MNRAMAEEAARRARAAQKTNHVSMGTCPLCGREITTDQHTAWRLVDGSPQRVHGSCLEPPLPRPAPRAVGNPAAETISSWYH